MTSTPENKGRAARWKRSLALLVAMAASCCTLIGGRPEVASATIVVPVQKYGLALPTSLSTFYDTFDDLAVDAAGNIYFTATTNLPYLFRIFKATPAGTVTTFAGTGLYGTSGDGGQATSAQIGYVSHPTFGPDGSLYFVDAGMIVRRVDPAGVITTVAGNGTATTLPGQGNGVSATSVALSDISDVEIAPDGTLYFLEGSGYSFAQALRVVSGGIINTVAFGMALASCSGVPGPLSGAAFNSIRAFAFDPSSNLYLSVSCGWNELVKVTPAGNASVFAGGGAGAFTDGATATAVALPTSTGLSADADGSLYFEESTSRKVWKVTSAGSVAYVAGSNAGGFVDGAAAADVLIEPNSYVVESAGSLLLTDWDGAVLGRIADGVLEVLNAAAGTGEPADGESAVGALLNEPSGMVFDATGNLLLGSTASGLVRSISPAGVLGTRAGNGVEGSPEAGPALSSPLSTEGLDLDASGNLLITNASGELAQVSPGGTLSLVPSSGSPLTGVIAVAPAPGGVVYVLDTRSAACGVATCFAPRIRKVTANGSVTVLYAPTPVQDDRAADLAYSPTNELMLIPAEGSTFRRIDAATGVAATVSLPNGVGHVAVDKAGSMFVVNQAGLSKVRRDGEASLVGTLGGLSVSDPGEIAINEDGDVYISRGGQIFAYEGVAAAQPPTFVPLGSPVRLVDTRPGQVGALELSGGSIGSDRTAALTGGAAVRFVVTDGAGIPASVAGLALNVTAVAPAGNGNLKVYPCASDSTPAPAVSTVNYVAGVAQANAAIAAPDASGGLCVLSSQNAHVIIDVSGYFPTAAGFLALAAPVRLLDTRSGQLGVLEQPDGSIGSDRAAVLSAGVAARFVVTDTSGIPSAVAGLALNITAVAPVGGGNLKVYPCASAGDAAPSPSTLNFTMGVSKANAAIAAPDATGGLCVLSSQNTHVIIDVGGYFATTSQFTALAAPVRLVDSRSGQLGVLEQPGGSIGSDRAAVLPAGVAVRFVVTNTSGIPVSPAGIAFNITAVGPAGGGNLKIYPCASAGSPPPSPSTLNYVAGVAQANAALAAPASWGVCVLSTQNTNVIIDVSGYFSG